MINAAMLDAGVVRSDREHWKLRRGANLTPTGTTFSVWALAAKSVVVQVKGEIATGEFALERCPDKRGVWEVEVADAQAGDRYAYRIDDDPLLLPDPVSRSQPDGVHGLSQIIDPDAHMWTDDDWKGLSLADFVIYEMHIGTFSPEGTFDEAAHRLRELSELGITAIELMPVGEFPGPRNWGYDGVDLYAPQSSYGGPDAMKRFVDEAHAHGMAVVLDVVYNHVGPEGNYLDRFGPYFTDVYRTPWGRAVNYDGRSSDAVRRWAHDNALYWVSEYHIDALRLDAVQGIFDFGAFSFLEELSDDIHALGRQSGRKVQLMAESDLNDPRLIRSPKLGGFGLDAQWSDDFHHTLHTTLTGESHGYYQDFAGLATMCDLYREPFFYAQRYAPHRDRMHGRSSEGVPRQRFVVAAQNHDQIGNRQEGDRLSKLVGPAQLRLAAALVLLSPYVPLLFMGEEYGETSPFLYFVSHSDEALITAVREGRQREFDALGKGGEAIDPQSEEPFRSSTIDWNLRYKEAGFPMLALYRDLLALRKEEPALRPGAGELHVQGAAEWMTVLNILPLQGGADDHSRSRRALFYAFNLFGQPLSIPVRSDAIGAWQLRFCTEGEGYGGSGIMPQNIPAADERLAVASDGPKRLMEQVVTSEPIIRTIKLPAYSAAVYTRDFSLVDAPQ